MAIEHLKTSKPDAERAADDAKIRTVVETTLADIERRGDALSPDRIRSNQLHHGGDRRRASQPLRNLCRYRSFAL